MTNRIIDIVRNQDLTHEGTADQGSYGVAPYVAYDGIANYSHRPAGALKGINGLTCGGWFQLTGDDFLMGAWQVSANQVWRLYLASNAVTLGVSSTGANEITVSGDDTTTGTWYFIAGRYTPSTELAVWLNDVKSIHTGSVPASLFDSASANFTIGGTHAGASLLAGKASMCWVSHETLADSYLMMLYQMQRHLFGV